MHDQTTSIEKFLEAAAAKQPTPGGGSAGALAGALAAAMGEMVVNYSVGKKGLESHLPKLQSALAVFHRGREMMLGFLAEDQSAYEALTAARKLPADSPNRESSIAAASLLCIQVPESMAITAVEMIGLADAIVEAVNPRLLSDLAACAELAMATTRVALYNVRVNLSDMADAERRRKIEETCERLLSRATALMKRVIPRIRERVSQS
ncbi:MAG: cyclodeaminase/cyclohydrolase family protein [Tepidisphaeraceae bacterium]